MFFDSLYIGPLRILCLIIFSYFFGKRIFDVVLPKDKLSYYVNRWMVVGAITYLMIVFIQQLGYYDLFTILLFIVVFILIKAFDINIKKLLFYKESSNQFLLKLVKDLENNYKPITIKKKFSFKKMILKGGYLIWVNIIVILIVLLYFLQYDIYSSTHLWFQDLVKIYNFNNQLWYTTNHDSLGDFPFISMYVKLTGISIEMGLRTFGILELLLITVLLFWFIKKCVAQSYIFTSLAMLVLVTFFIYVPINIKIMTMHQSLMLAISFFIPLAVKIGFSDKNTPINRNFYIVNGFVFLTILLIDFYVSIVLLPIYLLCVSLYNKNRKIILQYWLVFIITNLLGLFYIWAVKGNVAFKKFIQNNLISINSFMDFEQLVLPWQQLLLVYIGIIVMLFLLMNLFKNKINITIPLKSILAFTLVLMLLLFVNNTIIDKDFITRILTFFIPIIISFGFYLLAKLFYNYNSKIPRRIVLIINVSFIIVFTSGSYYIQKDTVKVENVSDNYANTVLDAYNQILINNLPYTYLVVNDSRKFVLNNNKHFLMSYYDFFTNYLDRDLIFNRYKNDKEELKKHPEYVLPNSVYVFTYDCAITDDEVLLKDETQKVKDKIDVFCKVNIILDELRDRGRNVREFYRKRNIIIYEIQNVENSSEISDLMNF